MYRCYSSVLANMVMEIHNIKEEGTRKKKKKLVKFSKVKISSQAELCRKQNRQDRTLTNIGMIH